MRLAEVVVTTAALVGCGGSADDTEADPGSTTSSVSIASGVTTTTTASTAGTAPVVVTSTAPAPPTPETTVPGAAPTTPGTGTSEVPTNRFRPPPLGTYAYSSSGRSDVSGGLLGSTVLPNTTTVVVSQEGGSASDLLMHNDLRDRSGNGIVSEIALTFADGAVKLRRVRVDAYVNGYHDSRNITPTGDAPVLLSNESSPGDTSSFEMSGSGARAVVTTSVRDPQPVEVDGETVVGAVLDLHAELTGQVTGHQDTRLVVATDVFLLLHEDVHTAVRVGLNDVSSDFEIDLQRRDPT